MIHMISYRETCFINPYIRFAHNKQPAIPSQEHRSAEYFLAIIISLFIRRHIIINMFTSKVDLIMCIISLGSSLCNGKEIDNTAAAVNAFPTVTEQNRMPERTQSSKVAFEELQALEGIFRKLMIGVSALCCAK